MGKLWLADWSWGLLHRRETSCQKPRTVEVTGHRAELSVVIFLNSDALKVRLNIYVKAFWIFMISATLRLSQRSFFMQWAAEIKTGQSEKEKRLNVWCWMEYLHPKAQRWAGWRGLLWNAVFWTWSDHHTPKLRAAVGIYTRPTQHQLGTVQMNGHQLLAVESCWEEGSFSF